MTKEPKLKSCPFCGVKPTSFINTLHEDYLYYIGCENKKCPVYLHGHYHGVETNVYDTKLKAIKAWNRRKGSS